MNCNSHLFSNLPIETRLALTRRQFFARGRNVVGAAALGSLLGDSLSRALANDAAGKPALPHFPPKAKNVVYLHMVGGPSQMDLYDYKPEMLKMYDKDLPDSIRNGQRLTGRPPTIAPVCISVIAGSWLIASVCIERMKAMSSTHFAV